MTETVITVSHNAIKLILPENSGSYAVIYLPKLLVSEYAWDFQNNVLWDNCPMSILNYETN